MSRVASIAGVAVIIGVLSLWFYLRQDSTNPVTQPRAIQETAPTLKEESPQEVNFTARFEIYTNGTKRIFTEAKYHHQSLDVYIENPDPSIIHVRKPMTTWDTFFKTLPFSLTKECLVTGTKQTFCTTDTRKLRFFINDIEKPNALDQEIRENDVFKVIYGN